MNLTEARRLAAKAKREQFERLFAHQCAVVGIAAPIPQYRFARDLGRFWTADFAWPDLKLLRETCGTDPETLARLVAEKNRLAADFRLIATEEMLTAAEVREAMFAGFQRVSGLRLAQP